MPRKLPILLPHFLMWLRSICNDINLDEGVSIDYIKNRYNKDNKIDLHVRSSFSVIMSKATEMLPYISMKVNRKRVVRSILGIIILPQVKC